MGLEVKESKANANLFKQNVNVGGRLAGIKIGFNC
jgi:hypothetical protein